MPKVGINFFPVSIHPAAGCKYFLTIHPALSVLHSSVGLAARVGAQAGFAMSRTLGCAQDGFATSSTFGLGFGIDFGFIMALNTVAIDLNT